MARQVCIRPCPANIVLPKMQVPLMGSIIKAQGTIDVVGGCSDCEIVTNFLLQIGPVFASLGIPLCLLGCNNALVNMAKATKDALGPPPDPTLVIQRLLDVIEKCKCVVSFVLPPPVGPICDFLKMVGDVLNLFTRIMACLEGLMTHLLSFSIKANVMLLSPEPSIRATGNCLIDQGQGMTDLIGQKLGALAQLVQVVQPVFDMLAETVPEPFATIINDFKTGFNVFLSGTVTGTAPSEFIEAIHDFNIVLVSVNTAYAAVVAVCP